MFLLEYRIFCGFSPPVSFADSLAAARPVAALTVHRTVIHYRDCASLTLVRGSLRRFCARRFFDTRKQPPGLTGGLLFAEKPFVQIFDAKGGTNSLLRNILEKIWGCFWTCAFKCDIINVNKTVIVTAAVYWGLSSMLRLL